MFTNLEKEKILDCYSIVQKNIKDHHIECFKGHKTPVFLISNTYPGVWLEHVYDSIILAKMNNDYMYVAKNTLNLFLDSQNEKGQLPCFVIDRNKNTTLPEYGFSQIQECVSFTRLCYEYFEISRDFEFLKKAYSGCIKWQNWYANYRMPNKWGLIECFCGHDTGHDGSGRKDGMLYPGTAKNDDASVYPDDDPVLPIIAPDVNAVYYGTLTALSDMANTLGKEQEAIAWRNKADCVKKRLIEVCYDVKDKFFYDVDKNGKMRKYLSIAITNVFSEHILDKNMMNDIYITHMHNENEFWTPYPFPSMAKSDPSFKQNAAGNSWGFYSQALTILRCTRWMDYYEKSHDFDKILEKWVRQWTYSEKIKFGQELHPITGEPSVCSEWYSSCMLVYLYAVKRLELI